MRAYAELKAAWNMFEKSPEALSGPERSRVEQVARKQMDISGRILMSPAAAGVVVPPGILAAQLDEMRRRYGSDEEYQGDLRRIGLSEADLVEAITRDLHVEAVLDKIAATTEPVSEVEAEIFYRLHPDAFERPEARRLRHILLTYGNTREKTEAARTLDKLRRTLASAEQFAAAALRHSQCPTALQEGVLGIVKRGQLYAELEPAAFGLKAGEISEVLESPTGLHILRCDQIFEAGRMPFPQVRDRIIDKLTEQRRRQSQRAWIASLAGR